jgi:hypothetical protein
MSSRVRLIFLLGICGIAAAQTPATPADIDPNSLSRFPLVPRSAMKTDADRAAYDYVVGTAPRTTPLLGPGGLSLYSPGSAEAIERLNRYLRNDSVIGRRLFELCAIIGAWEIEQQYEWSGHEPAALQYGVSQKAIDTVKFNRPIEGCLKTRRSSFKWAAKSCASTISIPKPTHTPSSCLDGKARWSYPSPWGTM